ncbi:MAG: glycosyltransferase family 4 protein [Verrucomicrobiota bacterium]|nr:glycosyltransferase family 4 protein [Verrucomicrobiota bacterium]
MKIAIIAPSPVPYTIGGAEKMWWGLQREINANTSHQAEIIKLPTKEHSFWDLVESYEAFSKLDLSSFDLVISGKYPAWMVSHPRHICYMQHRLRGLYDTYHYNNLPTDYVATHPELIALQELLQEPPTPEARDNVFELVRRLRYQHDLPNEAFRFPGPLIRQVLHFLDGVGLRRAAIESYFAISRTVAARRSYFPAEANVRVLYPPSNLEGLHGGRFDYIFTASRLDGAKRIALLIEAMKFVQADVPLRIAGEGPDRARLEAAAAGDERICFLGFRSDAELVDDYSNALAIAFVPQDEDYGLITIEAMMSGKPVITSADSGGPTEFVEHERTGLCVEPTPEQLGQAIEQLTRDRDAARAMGKAAQERVRGIIWANTVKQLLETATGHRPMRTARRAPRRKLTVATTFGITPVRGGGQARIFHFYKNLAPTFEIELITLGRYEEEPFRQEIAPDVHEVRVPRSAAHTEAENNISAEVEWFSITDVAFPELQHLTPAYREAVERSAQDAEAVVAAHPYPLTAIEAATDKPLWYEAQDVEFLLKSDVIPPTARGQRLIENVRRLEQRCCDRAALIMACSEPDREQLQKLYGVNPAKMRLVPNGIDSSATRFVPRSTAQDLKRELGLNGDFLAIFIGSWHQPNLDAVETILRAAEAQPDVQFLVLGSSGQAFQGRARPANVGFFGAVADETKAFVLRAADLALNPMKNGSGTNLKMLEYAASGVPILSTRTGLRGLAFEPESEVFVAPIEDFSVAIEKVRQTSPRTLQDMTFRARQRAAAQFDWRNIARRFLASI